MPQAENTTNNKCLFLIQLAAPGLTALGVFVLAAVFFNFFAMFEYSFLLIRSRSSLAADYMAKLKAVKDRRMDLHEPRPGNGPTLEKISSTLRDCEVDRQVSCLYMVLLVLFNAVYWVVYTRNDKFP